MSANEKAGQASKGLLDSVKGKAKEVAGAVTGNDSLTTEGQLQQRHAEDRREANTTSAVADAQAEQAAVQLSEARRDGAQQRSAVSQETAAVKDVVGQQQQAQHHVAEQAKQREVVAEQTKAEAEADTEARRAASAGRAGVAAAAHEEAEATAAHARSVREAERA